MRCLIFQVAVGEVPDFYETCMRSVRDYAARIGADYIRLDEPVLRIVPKRSQRSANALRLGYLPIFEKEAAFAHLGDYDAVAIIDADVYVTAHALNIFDQLGDADFAAVLERDLPLKPEFERKLVNYSRDQYKPLRDVDWRWDELGAAFYNMGVMLLGKSILPHLKGETPAQFIHRPEFERFVNGEDKFKWSTDQTLLNWWVKKSGMKVKDLDWRWNCIYGYVRSSALLSLPFFVHFNLAANMPRKGAEIPALIRSIEL